MIQTTGRQFVKTSISLPPDQAAWIREEAERQEHGNVSRIVQDAVREYRLRRMAEEMARTPQLSKVA